MTCVNCYWFKLRWRDGSGYCWQHQAPKHADESECKSFEAKVVWVNKPEDLCDTKATPTHS